MASVTTPSPTNEPIAPPVPLPIERAPTPPAIGPALRIVGEDEPRLSAAEAEVALLLHARRKRITVELYHRMADAGLLTHLDRVELVEGVLVEKMTKHPPHIIATELLERWLNRNVPDGWFASTGNPTRIVERDSEPEPDHQVVRGDPTDYAERTHGPAETALVVEVSDTSLPFDRRVKWRVYAAAGIPDYWILDVNRRVLEVHTGPAPEGYRQLRTLAETDEVTLTLDGREVARIAVSGLLARPKPTPAPNPEAPPAP